MSTTGVVAGPSSDVPQILYIMGTGRSGTTILEILLTNNPAISGVGEVTHIFQDGFTDDKECSCGARASLCPTWSAVRGQCGWLANDVTDLIRLFRSMSWHTRFPTITAGLVSRRSVESYRQANECLFRAAANLSGASVVVDSSKYAGRALMLSRLFRDRVRVICLTRSPAGLVAAFRKTDAAEQRPKKLLQTFAYYMYAMACFRVVAAVLGERVLRLRYEDLTADPASVLTRIEGWSGLDLSVSKNKLKNNQDLDIGHIVTGNRLRRIGSIRFKTGGKTMGTVGLLSRPVIWFMSLYRAILGF